MCHKWALNFTGYPVIIDGSLLAAFYLHISKVCSCLKVLGRKVSFSSKATGISINCCSKSWRLCPASWQMVDDPHEVGRRRGSKSSLLARQHIIRRRNTKKEIPLDLKFAQQQLDFCRKKKSCSIRSKKGTFFYLILASETEWLLQHSGLLVLLPITLLFLHFFG